MRTLLWKIRCAYWMRKLLGVSILMAWSMAESAVDSYGDDINIWSPRDAAEEERDAWAALSLESEL